MPPPVSPSVASQYAAGIVTLDLAQTNVADLSGIDKLPCLTAIDISPTKISDLSPLARCPKLSRVTMRRLHELTSLASLLPLRERLVHLDVKAHNSDLATILGNFPRLRTLAATFCALQTIAFVAQAPMAGLESLSVEGARLENVEPLRACLRLRHLVVDSGFRALDWSPLGALTHLETLKITNVTATTDVAPLATLSSLLRLSLEVFSDPDQLEPLDLSPLAVTAVAGERDGSSSPVRRGLTRLTHFKATGRAIQNVEALGTLATLQELDLALTKVADLAPLATLSQLKRAKLRFVPATDFHVVVRHWPRLEYLDVSWTAFDDWRACAAMPSLRELVIDGLKARSLAKLAVLSHAERLTVRVSD